MKIAETSVLEREKVLVKGKIGVFGDLHLSAKYEGAHRNYVGTCLQVMYDIEEIVKSENLDSIVFLGDIIGVNERNITDREFFYHVCSFFKRLNKACKGRVFSVVGNHDFGDFPDFMFLRRFGLLRNPKFIDLVNENNQPDTRFHFVNYGEESRELEILSNGSNVIFGHAPYEIDGVTNWYHHKDKVDLRNRSNFNGVGLIVSGHIHPGTTTTLTGKLPDGELVSLVFLGNPTRVTDRIESCQYLTFTYQDGNTLYESGDFPLQPLDKEFFPQDEFIIQDTNIDPQEEKRIQSLQNIIGEILKSRLLSQDVLSQIEAIPDASPSARNLALDYMRKALDMNDVPVKQVKRKKGA